MIASQVTGEVRALPRVEGVGADAGDREDVHMDRGWIETIRLLGLDVVLLVTVAMAVLDWIIHRVGNALNRRVVARQVARGASNRLTRAGETPRSGTGQPEIAWPPVSWRASH